MNRDDEDRQAAESMDFYGSGVMLDDGPLNALMRQPVGDVLAPEDEAALLMLSLDAAERGAAALPLARSGVALLSGARLAGMEDAETAKALVGGVRRWAE